jgi:hypothetical protein
MKRLNKVLEFKENVPQSVKNALNKIGDKNIVSARLGRTPVQAIIQGLLKTVANVPYDDLFHLFIELTLDNGQTWVLEKIERINLVKENRSKKKGAEFTSSFPVNKTVNELFINTKNKMGARFLPYQSASNNCQVFIMGVLDGNGLNNSERTSFVKQDTKSIFKSNPALRKFANTLTDVGGYVNAIKESTDLLRNSKKKKSLSDIGLADKDNKQTISDIVLKTSEPAFVSPEQKVEKVSESTEVVVENKAE